MNVVEYPVGATRTTARIVEALLHVDDAGVTELATELDLSKASVHNHLVTLERLGLVLSEDGRYRLGLGFLDVGMTVRDRMGIYRAAETEVPNLAESTGESANLVVPEHGHAVYADVHNAERNDRRTRLGTRLPLHTTAAGKLVLAFRSREAVADYVADYGLSARTDRTVETAADLREELRSVKDRGLAFDRGEAFAEMRGVAAPIRTDDGIAGALSVLGPRTRLSGKRLEEDLPGLVLSAAKRVELSLSE